MQVTYAYGHVHRKKKILQITNTVQFLWSKDRTLNSYASKTQNSRSLPRRLSSSDKP
jgi:hypothetical protein